MSNEDNSFINDSEIESKDFIPTKNDKKVFELIGMYPCEVEKILQKQLDGKFWTLYDERALLDSLLMHRIHFFILFFTADLLLANNCSTYLNAALALLFGSIISFILAITTQRIYFKLQIILQMLYSLGDEHCLPVTKKIYDHRSKKINTSYISECIKKMELMIKGGVSLTGLYLVSVLVACSLLLFLLMIINLFLMAFYAN
jgi:hypothetical protein